MPLAVDPVQQLVGILIGAVLTGASVLLALTSLPLSPITHLQMLCDALLQRLTHETELAYLWFSMDWHRGDVLRSTRRTVLSTYTRQLYLFRDVSSKTLPSLSSF